MDRTITVYSQAEISVSPDTVTVCFTVSTNGDNYNSALENARKISAELTASIIETGIEKQGIKTDDFNVRKIERFERTLNGNLTAVNAGYCCSQVFEIEFDCDKKVLDSLLKLLNLKVNDFSPRISFSIKNKSDYEAELFRKVTENAMRKAKAFCAPANARIGKLISVDCNNSVGNMWTFPTGYGHTTLLQPMRSEKHPYGTQPLAVEPQQSANSFDNIIPQDKTITDNAVFVWEIIDVEL